MRRGNQPHILSSASNLLGICFVIITGLKLTKMGLDTYADEISLISALLLMFSCVLSYLSIRNEKPEDNFERLADHFYLGGLLTLFMAVLIIVTDSL